LQTEQKAGIISTAISERMVKATGLHNLLVHEYGRIHQSIFWQVLSKHPKDPIDFVQAMMQNKPR
jgi:uncharacterized protein YutE (UPF0331/DUF86 family)